MTQSAMFSGLERAQRDALVECLGELLLPVVHDAVAEHVAAATVRWLRRIAQDYSLDIPGAEPLLPTLNWLVESLREGRLDG